MNSLNAVKRLAQADIPFYLLPLIMLNLILGTLAQAEMGLYAAQKNFFGSFIAWVGPVPLPGGYALMGLLTLSLLIKFLLDTEWSLRRAGINLAHLGTLTLLAGGLFTSLSAREGFMLIAEGQSSPYMYDYARRDLYIFLDETLAKTVPFEKMDMDLGLPFSVKVAGRCENCAISKHGAAEGQGKETWRGMAKFMTLSPKAPEKSPEENIAGVTLEISGVDEKNDGTYIAFEGMPKPIILNKNGHVYKIMFGREQRALPFSIYLNDFRKETYPGLDMAKAYHSDVQVMDSGATWPARIEMNGPLRYKGYTFYQSSFQEGPAGEATILSVVENKGRIFPYIGTGLIGFGVLLHFYMMARRNENGRGK